MRIRISTSTYSKYYANIHGIKYARIRVSTVPDFPVSGQIFQYKDRIVDSVFIRENTNQ